MTPLAIERAEIDSATAAIKAALRAGDMDAAWTQVSRKIGNRIAAGEIVVKLKRHRL